MSSIKINIVYIAIMTVFDEIQSLVKLSAVEDNSIKLAETIIRQTVNELFTTFKNQDVKRDSKFQQFSTIHNYFIPITVTHCCNLNKVIELSRVNDVDNNTQHLIVQVNEVISESNKNREVKDYDMYVIKYIESFIEKLKYMKDKYVRYLKTVNDKATLNGTNNNKTNSTNDLAYKDNIKAEETIEEQMEDENMPTEYEYWKPSGRRLYRGIPTRIKKFPFMASVQFFKKFQCAGTIIKNDLIITSASCLQLLFNNRFFRENPAFVSVQVGSDYYELGGENIGVQEIYFHPEYDPKTVSNNLAIMRLERVLKLKSKHRRVKKIEIDRNPFSIPINYEKITVVGWGAKDSSNILYNVLRNKLSYTELDYYPLYECQEHYSRKYVTKKNFCAGFFSKGGGACNHDAGGPAIIDGILVGVISFGSPICGSTNTPTVFTKLGFYADWIDGIMEKEVPNAFKRTTSAPPSRVFRSTEKRITKTLKVTPMGTTQQPMPVNELAALRIPRKHSSDSLFSFIANSEENRERFEKQTSTSKEIEDQTLVINKMREGLTTQTIIERVHINNTTTGIVPVSRHTTKAKERILQQPSSEDNSSEASNETISEPVKENGVLKEIGDDKAIENDIMALVDNLNIDQLFDEKKKQKINEVMAEQSNELTKDMGNLTQYFLNNPSSSDKDEDGLSISMETFQNVSLGASQKSANDTASKLMLFDLVSLAIKEEAIKTR